MSVTNAAEFDLQIAHVKEAQAKFASFSQEQVDRIFRQAAFAAANARIPLAMMNAIPFASGIGAQANGRKATKRQEMNAQQDSAKKQSASVVSLKTEKKKHA